VPCTGAVLRRPSVSLFIRRREGCFSPLEQGSGVRGQESGVSGNGLSF
jgi:hypothetical protein